MIERHPLIPRNTAIGRVTQHRDHAASPSVMGLADPQQRQAANARARVHRVAGLMDSSFRLPGGFRIGMDGLIGLIPVVGDLATAGASFYIVSQAARAGVPSRALARMVLNVGLDAVVGAIPILGDVFDFAFKANLRNARLMETYLHRSTPR